MTDATPLVETIEYVVIGEGPVSEWDGAYEDSGLTYPILHSEWATLPKRWADVLAELVRTPPDEAMRCARCDDEVGYVGVTREDTHGREMYAVEWTVAALVAGVGGVVEVQCEDCRPVTVGSCLVSAPTREVGVQP